MLNDLLTAFLVAFVAVAASGLLTRMQLEAKIPLGEVRGRIDHMAIDLVRQRLFVAELATTPSGLSTSRNVSSFRRFPD